MKNLIYTLLLCSFSFSLFAQDFNSSVGLRLGIPLGISYKMFLTETAAVEGIVGYRNFGLGNWLSLDGAYQIHQDIELLDELQWYYGGGLGVNRFSFSNTFGSDNFSSTFISLKAYIGLSYTLEDIPLNFSLDFTPSVYIGGGLGGVSTIGLGLALSARYVIN